VAEPRQVDEDPWLTLPEIAEEMRVHPATVRWWVHNGHLAAVRGGARRWLVRRSELERMKHVRLSEDILEEQAPAAFDPYVPETMHPGVRVIDPSAS